MPTNELALSNDNRGVVKPKGNKRQIDKWSLYPERSVLDIIMATEVMFLLLALNFFKLYCLLIMISYVHVDREMHCQGNCLCY